MIYGMLIGLIISSALMTHQNHGTPATISDAAAITRQVIKILSSTVCLTSICALIGLVIRGA